MPSLLTEITEIATGLGTLGYSSVEAALATRPSEMLNIPPGVWSRLDKAITDPQNALQAAAAWSNGLAFLHARNGLRGRLPIQIEWRGPEQTPGFDLLPVDLRIDHVFLISCKYLSHILFNASPSHLFDRVLAHRHSKDRMDWYEEVAPVAYQAFYTEVRRYLLSEIALPEQHGGLNKTQRRHIKRRLKGNDLPSSLVIPYRDFCVAESSASAARWRANLGAAHAQEEMLWRLLRIGSAPYYVLGASPKAPIRLRVYTPWDWRREFTLVSFDVASAPEAGQPVVRWKATVNCRSTMQDLVVEGHVQIRWSHGRFYCHPEAKVYLDTPHAQVPGYTPLV